MRNFSKMFREVSPVTVPMGLLKAQKLPTLETLHLNWGLGFQGGRGVWGLGFRGLGLRV